LPEPRQLQHRRERIADALRDEIGALLEGELADPRIGLATVTDVVLESGGKLARVYVEVQGTDEEAEQTMKALEKAKGFIRHSLLESLGLRKVPELLFYNDRSSKDEARIDELLDRMKKRKK